MAPGGLQRNRRGVSHPRGAGARQGREKAPGESTRTSRPDGTRRDPTEERPGSDLRLVTGPHGIRWQSPRRVHVDGAAIQRRDAEGTPEVTVADDRADALRDLMDQHLGDDEELPARARLSRIWDK